MSEQLIVRFPEEWSHDAAVTVVERLEKALVGTDALLVVEVPRGWNDEQVGRLKRAIDHALTTVGEAWGT